MKNKEEKKSYCLRTTVRTFPIIHKYKPVTAKRTQNKVKNKGSTVKEKKNRKYSGNFHSCYFTDISMNAQRNAKFKTQVKQK